jgi:hypothetical protein
LYLARFSATLPVTWRHLGLRALGVGVML